MKLNFKGDSCSMGADAHVWHVFLLKVGNAPPIRVEEVEGNTPIWLALDDALKGQLTSPVRYIIQRYGDLLANQ